MIPTFLVTIEFRDGTMQSVTMGYETMEQATDALLYHLKRIGEDEATWIMVPALTEFTRWGNRTQIR